MTSSEGERAESQERILHSVYDHMLRSVVVSYASNMHEMIKTGGISASELQTPSSRQEIFPELYEGKTQEEIQAQLETYATEIPTRQSRKRKLRQATPLSSDKNSEKSDDDDKEDDDENEKDDEDFKVKPEEGENIVKTKEESGPAIQGNQDHQPPGVDIWGRIPPKEPKIPVECTLCGRHLSSSRFASHLEKCMGLSTRPSANVPNRSGSASSSLK